MSITLITDDYYTAKYIQNILKKHQLHCVFSGPKGNTLIIESAAINDTHVQLGKNIFFNREEKCIFKNGTKIPLSQLEFKLLNYLSYRLNTIVSSEELINEVWGLDAPIGTDTLYVYINRLRKKIELCACNPEILLTHRKIGYELKTI